MPLISIKTHKDIRKIIRLKADIWKIAKNMLGKEISKIRNIFKVLQCPPPNPPLQKHLWDIYLNQDVTKPFPLYEFQEPMLSSLKASIRALPFMDEDLLPLLLENRVEGIKRKAIALILPDAIVGKAFRKNQSYFAKHARPGREKIESVDERNEIIRKAAQAIKKECKRRDKSINEIALELSTHPYNFISVNNKPLSQRQIRKIIS